MANINLGNIRRLGFIRGLADSELARQAAQAKIAEEDRAYQRLLKRDEALREYQSAEAEKTRAFTKSQAEILAEQTKARQEIEDARYKAEQDERIRQFDIKEKRAERQETQRRKEFRIQEDRLMAGVRTGNQRLELERDRIKAAEEERKEEARRREEKEASAVALLEVQSLAKQGKPPQLEILKAKHPNVPKSYLKQIVDIYAVEAGGVNKKQLNEKADSIYKDFKTGKLADELVESSFNVLKEANHFSVKNMTLPRFKRENSTIRLTLENSKPGSQKMVKNFEDGFSVSVFRPSHVIDGIKESNKGGDQVRQRLSFLKEDAANIRAKLIEQYTDLKKVPQPVKDDIKKYLEDRISKFSSGSEVTEGRDKNAMFRITQKAIKGSVPLLNELFGENGAQQLLDNSGLRIKRENTKSYSHRTGDTTTKYYPELNEKKVTEFMSRRPDVLSMLRDPESIQDKTSEEYIRSNLLRQIKTGGYKISTMNKENQPVISELVNTFVGPDGKVDTATVNKIGTALETITPEYTYTYENGVEKEIPNPYKSKQTKSEATEAAKAMRLAETNFIASNEVIGLTDEISELSLGTTASAGQAGRLAGAVDTLVAVVEEVGAYIKDNAQGVFNKITVSLDGKDTNLGDERRAALEKLNGNAIDRPEDIEEKRKMISRVEKLAAKRIKGFADAVDRNEMSSSEAERRKIIELKKIALTYRMSGILQGDSSGRTISNQDFDVALQAVWTEGAFLGARMADIKKFFEARRNISQAIMDYGNSGLSRVMLGVASEFNKQLSKSYLRQLMPKSDAEIDAGLPEVSTFRSVKTGKAVGSPQGKISSSNRIIVEDQNIGKGIRNAVILLQKVTKNNDSLSSLTDALKKHKGETRFNYNANPRATNFKKAKETDFNRIIDGTALALVNQYAEDNNITNKSRLLTLKKDIYMTIVNTLKSRVGVVTTGLEGN